MPILLLQRWTPGLNKVALTKLLHSRAYIPLSLAKRYVDEFLDGHEVAVTVRSLRTANEIARDAEGIGAVASVGEHTPLPAEPRGTVHGAGPTLRNEMSPEREHRSRYPPRHAVCSEVSPGKLRGKV